MFKIVIRLLINKEEYKEYVSLKIMRNQKKKNQKTKKLIRECFKTHNMYKKRDKYINFKIN